MNVRHRIFEVQCVLASSGQLSGRRLEKLREHAANCAVCRKHLRDLAELNVRMWTAISDRSMGPAPKGMTERFVLRAIREGVPLAHQPVCRSMGWTLALSTFILFTIIGMAASWYVSGRGLNAVTSDTATPVAMEQSPIRPGSEGSSVGDKAQSLGGAEPAKIMRQQQSGSRTLPPKLRSISTRNAALLFTNVSYRESVRSGKAASSLSVLPSNAMAPALVAWLLRQSSPPTWASLTYHRNCVPGQESFQGTQLWSGKAQSNVSGAPVFRFDPQIALVADSKLPQSMRLRWDPTAESSLSAFVTAGTPVITH